MKDIEIATLILMEEKLALVVVKDGQVIFKSKEKGIKPMFILATEMKEEAQGATLADRIIGKGAAILCGYVGIREVYAELISEGGAKILEKYNMIYTMGESCPYIKNRDNTDYCPIEKISLDTEEPTIFLQKIKEFFASIIDKKGEI